MIATITIILLVLITTFLSVTLFFSLKRINQYEDLLVEIEQIIKFSSQKMKIVDDKVSFESDDEVGFFFEQIKSIQELLGNIFDEGENNG